MLTVSRRSNAVVFVVCHGGRGSRLDYQNVRILSNKKLRPKEARTQTQGPEGGPKLQTSLRSSLRDRCGGGGQNLESALGWGYLLRGGGLLG